VAASKARHSFSKARLFAGLFVVFLGGTATAAPPTSVPPPPKSLEQACTAIGGRLRSVGKETCLKARLQPSGSYSVQGMPLLYRDFPAGSSVTQPAHRVLMIGGIHGDELVAVSISFQWMQRLEADTGRRFHWRVLPSSNPDGLLTRPSTRGNSRGVDLNRNFPTPDWKKDALRYWETRAKRDPRRYPGPEALSEPETRWLVQQIESFKPDAIVSIHAPYGVLDFDGPDQPPKRFGYLRLHQLGTYPGSLGNYAGTTLGMPVITLELPHAGIMPTPAQSERVWADMQDWLNKNLTRQPPQALRGATLASDG
jgi:protein MpaA